MTQDTGFSSAFSALAASSSGSADVAPPAEPERFAAYLVDPSAQTVRPVFLPFDADGATPDLAAVAKALGLASPAEIGWATLSFEPLGAGPDLEIQLSGREAAARQRRALARYALAYCGDRARGALCQPRLAHGTNASFVGQALVAYFEDYSDGDSRPVPPPISAQQFGRRCGFEAASADGGR
jgi:hypothetical protein